LSNDVDPTLIGRTEDIEFLAHAYQIAHDIPQLGLRQLHIRNDDLAQLFPDRPGTRRERRCPLANTID